MSWFWNALILLGFTILISIVSYYIFGIKGPWKSFWIKVLIFFLFLLTISLWIKPIGPEWYGIQWVVILIGSLLFLLLLVVFSAPSDEEPKIPTNLSLTQKKRLANEYANQRNRFILSMSMMFWLLLMLLIILVLTGYYYSSF